jgi:pentatricopeptide repeat protein
VNSMKDSGTHVSVQANTALLKGYAHSGQIEKGDNLFKQMMETRGEQHAF